jgi:hypothetical protein
MPKKLTQMPVVFELFESAVKSKYPNARILNQQISEKELANIFAARTPNNVKTEIKFVRGHFVYVAGNGLSPEKLSVVKEEIISKGMTIFDARTDFLYINIWENIMEGFITLYDIISDIENIVQQRTYARLGIKFNAADAYIFIAETLQNAIKRGQPWAVSRGYGGFDALDKVCVVGYSVQGRLQEKSGRNAYREHIVPCDFMMREAIRMFEMGATVEEVASMFEKNNKILLISDDEATKVDSKHKTTMPDGWKIGDDILARIHYAGIVME